LCFAGQAGPLAQPIAFVFHQGRYLAGINHGDDRGDQGGAWSALPDAEGVPRSGTEAVLLIDEGTLYFDLRAIYVRGLVTATAPPPGAPAGHRWFEVAPETAVAWDYGQLRVAGGVAQPDQ
jgi:hypothetical protein